ncbi:unnamed protein product, partial [Polarella glacialis]
KPGQYQDLMVLGSTGSNQAYTYLHEDYGEMGRKMNSPCFGFQGNVTDDAPADGSEDPKQRYFYTMVLDSDTVCQAHSIRKLVETAEHPKNRAYGIINANLANDYGADDKCTWHMWRNALMEVSTVNLQRGQFWIFNRVGFYGKGLIRNETYISRLIGKPGSVIEALPIDILSHDTVEAKLLQPGIAGDVTLYEVSVNQVDAAVSYHSNGTYAPLVKLLTRAYSLVTKWEIKKPAFVRWRDVPCATSAEYLSHTGFRLFHAGPGILLVNIFTCLLAQQNWGLQLVILPVVGVCALLFTILALFIIPKGFLILDKLPSLRLGKYLLCTSKPSKIGDGTFNAGKTPGDTKEGSNVINGNAGISDGGSGEDDERHLNRCSVLVRQLTLAIIEILLSLFLFSPELVLGVIRIARGVWAQVTGCASWQPQDQVEREIEQNLSFCYVLRKTWLVFVCGLAYMAYVLIYSIEQPLVWFLIVPWLSYPLTTYIMCLPVPEACRKSWIWTWVMDIKKAENRLA